MRLHGNAGGRPRRLVIGVTTTAALAVTLAACSSSASTPKKHVAAARPASVASSAAAPTTSAPAAPAAAPASGLSGKWSGQYGGAFQGTFILKWRQSSSKLNGNINISAPSNTLPIHGTVRGDAIRFGTVGSVGIQYSGTVSGNSMSGTYKVLTPNGSVGGPWSASKSS